MAVAGVAVAGSSETAAAAGSQGAVTASAQPTDDHCTNRSIFMYNAIH